MRRRGVLIPAFCTALGFAVGAVTVSVAQTSSPSQSDAQAALGTLNQFVADHPDPTTTTVPTTTTTLPATTVETVPVTEAGTTTVPAPTTTTEAATSTSAATTTTITSTSLPPTSTSSSSTSTSSTTTTTTLPPQLLGKVYGGVSMPYEQTLGLSQAAIDKQADELVNVGAGWHRGDYPWSVSQPTKTGGYTWSTVDMFILADRARGIQSLPILYFTPAWARAGGTTDKYPPTNVADYGNWVGAACTHLATLGVTWVELWNEENLDGFFKPMATNADRDKYIALAKDAATKCHAAVPSMKVLVGGLSTADSVFQAGNSTGTTGNGLYSSMDYYGQKGLYAYVDGVGWHPYLDDYFPGTDADSTGSWARWAPKAIANALAILDRYAPGKALQLWTTESAAPRSNNSQTDQATKGRQAFEAFLTGGFAAPYRDRLGPFMWFCLRDRAIAGNGGTGDASREDTFGLFTNDWLVKFPAWQTVHDALAKPLT